MQGKSGLKISNILGIHVPNDNEKAGLFVLDHFQYPQTDGTFDPKIGNVIQGLRFGFLPYIDEDGYSLYWDGCGETIDFDYEGFEINPLHVQTFFAQALTYCTRGEQDDDRRKALAENIFLDVLKDRDLLRALITTFPFHKNSVKANNPLDTELRRRAEINVDPNIVPIQKYSFIESCIDLFVRSSNPGGLGFGGYLRNEERVHGFEGLIVLSDSALLKKALVADFVKIPITDEDPRVLIGRCRYEPSMLFEKHLKLVSSVSGPCRTEMLANLEEVMLELFQNYAKASNDTTEGYLLYVKRISNVFMEFLLMNGSEEAYQSAVRVCSQAVEYKVSMSPAFRRVATAFGKGFVFDRFVGLVEAWVQDSNLKEEILLHARLRVERVEEELRREKLEGQLGFAFQIAKSLLWDDLTEDQKCRFGSLFMDVLVYPFADIIRRNNPAPSYELGRELLGGLFVDKGFLDILMGGFYFPFNPEDLQKLAKKLYEASGVKVDKFDLNTRGIDPIPVSSQPLVQSMVISVIEGIYSAYGTKEYNPLYSKDLLKFAALCDSPAIHRVLVHPYINPTFIEEGAVKVGGKFSKNAHLVGRFDHWLDVVLGSGVKDRSFLIGGLDFMVGELIDSFDRGRPVKNQYIKSVLDAVLRRGLAYPHKDQGLYEILDKICDFNQRSGLNGFTLSAFEESVQFIGPGFDLDSFTSLAAKYYPFPDSLDSLLSAARRKYINDGNSVEKVYA